MPAVSVYDTEMLSVVVLLRNIQMVSVQDGTTTQFPNGTEETPAAIMLSTCGYLPARLIKKIGLEKPFYSYLFFFSGFPVPASKESDSSNHWHTFKDSDFKT